MRAFGRTLLMAFFVATVPLSGCFGKEEVVVEDVDEFDEFGGYSVVAPIDTGINVYHNHFAMNGTYPDWLLEGLGVTCLLYTSPSPRDRTRSRMPSSA